MDPFATLPSIVQMKWVLITLALVVIAFHLQIFFVSNLSKEQWVWTDYCWLTIAFVGVIGIASENRRMIAADHFHVHNDRVVISSKHLRERLEWMASGPLICRKFIKDINSPEDPEFTRRQKQYDLACEWYRKTSRSYEVSVKTINPIMSLPAKVTDPMLLRSHKRTINLLEDLNTAIEVREKRRRDTLEAPGEKILRQLAPFLLAIAIAIRLSKVTGEILLERAKYRANSSQSKQGS